MDNISRELDGFVFNVYGYVKEYAKRGTKPTSRQGFGHASDICGAIRFRERRIQGIKASYSRLSEDDKQKVYAACIAFFADDNSYNDNDVRSLVKEALAIAEGQTKDVKLVTEHFADRLVSGPIIPKRYYGRNNELDTYTYCG